MSEETTPSTSEPSPDEGEQKVPVAESTDQISKTEELHAAKLEIVKLLNAKRAAAGVPPLEFDSLVSTTADKHCQEMVSNGTLSHWDSAGRKPYQRYFEGGSRDHIDERVGGDDAVEGASFEATPEKALEMMKGLHEDFAQTGEASRALAPGHTHVGIGVALNETHFRYIEIYVARYVEIDAASLTPVEGVDAVLKGKVLGGLASGRSGKWGPIACVVYRETVPTPMSVDDLATLDAYEDFSEQRAAVTWPWEMTFDAADGSFEIPISFDVVEEGQYYVMLYVREDPETIPYTEMAEGLAIPGEGFVEATGVMLTYSGPTISRNGDDVIQGDGAVLDDVTGGATEAPIVDVQVVTEASEPTLAERLVREGYQTQSVGNGTPEGVAPGLQLFFLRSRDPTSRPITSITFVTGDDVEPNLEALPAGAEVVGTSLGLPPSEEEAAAAAAAASPTNADDNGKEARIQALTALLAAAGAADVGQEASNGTMAEIVWESEDVRSSLEDAGVNPSAVRAFLERNVDGTSTLDVLAGEFSDAAKMGVVPKAGKYTYLCVGRGDITATTDGIADLVLCRGDAREGRNALGTATMSETVLLPIRGLSISYRRTQALVEEEESMGGMNNEFGSIEEFDSMGSQMMDDGDNMMDGDNEDAFRRRAEEEYERDQDNEDVRRDQQRNDLIRLLREAESENSSARAKNAALDKQAALYLHSLGSKKAAEDKAAAEQGQPRKSQSELGQQYAGTLRTIGDNMSRLERDQVSYDREALDLQARLEEKEEKVESVREAFTNFKSEIAKAAENSRSGKPIPRKIIRQFEETELKKDEDVSKVRLRNINLRTQLKKLEGKVREKEQLADGLHLIDFEQLKIENQTLNEKIEERNEELHKLRKKTTTTVQVLTHIKEKLQFEKAQNEVLKQELATLDTELTAERDQLSKSKRARERMRAEGTALQGEQGFVSNDSLVQDYERRKIALREKNAKVVQLQQKHAALMASINRDSMALNGGGNGPVLE